MNKLLRFSAIGLIALAAVVAIFASHASFAAAATAPAAGTGTPTTKCGSNLACVQNVGYGEIARRIAALNVLIARVSAHTHLTSAQQSAITEDAQTNISGLNTLNSKLKGETDVTAARTDVQDIFTNFRIFAVVLPRDYGEIYLDHMQNVHDAVTAKEPEIQSVLQQAQSQGIDITKEQGQLTDLETQVTNAGTQLSNAQGLIPSLTPANYPGTDQTIAQYHTDLKTAHTDLKAAAVDLTSIIAELKAAGFTKATPTPAP
jgi:hypothetical protein